MKPSYAMPFDTPLKELDRMRKMEVMYSEQIDELKRMSREGMIEVNAHLTHVYSLLEGCRREIKRFKRIHRVKE